MHIICNISFETKMSGHVAAYKCRLVLSDLLTILASYNYCLSDSCPSFVLLTCDDEKLNSIINELKNIPIVSDVLPVQGMYDIIVYLNTTSNNTVKENTRTKIRYINGVRSTLTLLGQQTS